MASEQQVKQYLAYWFQLGKKIILSKGGVIATQKVVESDRYSPDFEKIWGQILDNKTQAYLEGTSSTIEDLLSPKWDILPCARCELPVPMIDLGFKEENCPCADLDNWPNNQLPPPRIPMDTQKRLSDIRQRLLKSTSRINVGQRSPEQNDEKKAQGIAN